MNIFIKPTPLLFAVLVLGLASCSFKPVGTVRKFNGPEDRRVMCTEPPKDIVVSDQQVSLVLQQLQKGVTVQAGIDRTIEHIRKEGDPLQVLQVAHYRMCVEYANGVLDREKYANFLSFLYGGYLLNGPQEVKSGESTSFDGGGDKKQSKLSAEIAQNLERKGDYWVYLGSTMRNEKEDWLERYFSMKGHPAKGQKIKALSDTFKRSDKPAFKKEAWTKGNIVGLLRKNEEVEVIETAEIPGTKDRFLWWAKVKN